LKFDVRKEGRYRLEFPVPSPLVARVELRLAGLELDGVPVELPVLFLEPEFRVDLPPAL
jgi:hypothetical protein